MRLDGLTPEQWNLDTPAPGWTIADQVSHLAYFDDAAALSSADADRFRTDADDLMGMDVDFASIIAARYRALSGDELLAWFRAARRNLHGSASFGVADCIADDVEDDLMNRAIVALDRERFGSRE